MIGQRWIMSDNERPRGIVRDIPAATSCGNLNEARAELFTLVPASDISARQLSGMREIDDERIHFDCRVAPPFHRLSRAPLASAGGHQLLGDVDDLGADHHRRAYRVQSGWADGEGGEGGGGHGGEGGDGHRATCNRLSTD
jgi:hypothetical protein